MLIATAPVVIFKPQLRTTFVPHIVSCNLAINLPLIRLLPNKRIVSIFSPRPYVRNVTNFKVKCGYPECCASFTNIKSLQRHLRQNHPEFYWSKVGHTTHSSAHEDSDVDGDESVVEEGLEKETQIQRKSLEKKAQFNFKGNISNCKCHV